MRQKRYLHFRRRDATLTFDLLTWPG